MAKNKNTTKDMKDDEIKKFVDEKREALRKSRFGTAGSKGKNISGPRALRKDIARALTEMNARKNNS